MSIFDLFFGRSASRPSEGLGGFIKKEAEDLELHVSQCARRYDDLRAAVDSVRILIWIVIVLLVITRVIDPVAILNIVLK